MAVDPRAARAAIEQVAEAARGTALGNTALGFLVASDIEPHLPVRRFAEDLLHLLPPDADQALRIYLQTYV